MWLGLPGLVGERLGQPGRDRPAALGAAGVVPAVGADGEHRLGVRGQPERPARGQRREVEVVDAVQVVEDGGLEPRLGVVGVRREHPDPGMGAQRLVGPPDQQHLRAGGRGPLAQLGADARGHPRVPQRVLTPGPGVLDEQEGAHRRRRPGHRLGARLAGGGAAEAHALITVRIIGDDPEQPFPDQAPGQHQPALLVERQVARAGAPSRSADLLEGGPDPGRYVEDPVAEEHLEPVALVDQHAGVARAAAQQGVVVDRVERQPVDQRALEPRWPRGEEAAYLGVDHVGRVDGVQPVGDVGEVPAQLVGQGLRVRRGSRPAGGRRGPRRPGSSASARPGRAR